MPTTKFEFMTMHSLKKKLVPALALAFVYLLPAFSGEKDDVIDKNYIILNEKDEKIKHLVFDKDTTNHYFEILNDDEDSLIDEHPAHDIYNNIWTCDRLNPYQVAYNEIQDSIYIDCAEFVLPVPGYVTSKFGQRRYRFHYGIDLKLYTGDDVLAAFSGKVRIIDFDKKGYGHYVVIRHNNGLETVYGHLSKVLVEKDQLVSAGDLIALGGSTGRSTGPHLHFETRYLGNAINPSDIIDFDKGVLHNELYLITQEETFAYQKKVQQLNSAKYYSIKKGDTLGHIASRNGTSVNSLCRLNNISTKSVLRPGQRIRIK